MNEIEHPPDPPEIVGQRLKALRLAAGFKNQSAFAGMIGVAPQAWNNWERGRQLPSLPQVAQIRRATGVTSDFIFWGSLAGIPLDLATKLRTQLDRRRA